MNAIAASIDGQTIYMVAKTSKHLGTYAVSTGAFTDEGEISGLPGGGVLISFSPSDTVYVASRDDNTMYSTGLLHRPGGSGRRERGSGRF